MRNEEQHNLTKSEIVEAIPLACTDELAAVELFEELRWGKNPGCVHCGSVDVYKMVDAKTGQRNSRYLWRCHDCGKQYTVRIGTVYEESRIDLRHWAYAFWRASTSKKGVAALEIMRQCQISYKSALFLMNRIRFAMAPLNPEAEKLSGIVECDETFVGGKPRPHSNSRRKKTPVFAAVERGGRIRRRVIADVSGNTLKSAIRELVAKDSRIMTDESASYKGIGYEYDGGHQWVTHSTGEYAYRDIYTNTAESSFAILKRGIMGIYHSVSKEYLHRYLWQFDFVWNLRKLNDGERTVAAIQSAEGKRLMYKQPVT
ncbi:transposase [Acidobacteriia bacterium SbA2]|nr:transposase [Acidobacteriia bacterium SbA2]